jgi:hypothetical protein
MGREAAGRAQAARRTLSDQADRRFERAPRCFAPGEKSETTDAETSGRYIPLSLHGFNVFCVQDFVNLFARQIYAARLPRLHQRHFDAFFSPGGFVGAGAGYETVTSAPSGKAVLPSRTTTPLCTRPGIIIRLFSAGRLAKSRTPRPQHDIGLLIVLASQLRL